VGVENYLEFHINRYCMINIEPKDQILTRIRLDWTLDEFYADGGSTKFVDRLSGTLGIHAADLKVVAVYKGSVNVMVSYQAEETRSQNQFKRKLRKSIQNEKIDLGAPILDAEFIDGDNIEMIVISDENASSSSSSVSSSSSENEASSSSSNSTGVQIGNSTIVISNQGNTTTDEPKEQEQTEEPISESFIDSTKIAVICVVLTIVLVALIVISLCLYKRNKELAKSNYANTMGDSPELFTRTAKSIENAEKKKAKNS